MTRMNIQSPVDDYIRQTGQRMSDLIHNLRLLQETDWERVPDLLAELYRHEQLSLEAGFRDVSALTRDMAECLSNAFLLEHPISSVTIETLLDACRAITLHAEGVATGAIPT